MVTLETRIDPIKYEMFLHRLWAIGEEGRITLQRVTGSPMVAQGGECISAFYDPRGNMIMACSGHLRFAAATSDAIKKIIEWYSGNPGIRDGDQFFANDPYIAGSHVYDTLVMKPVFYRGQLVAWVSTGMHTADTGGVLRAQATEIYHEGVRIGGIKLVENDQVREDIFRSIVSQCRDPDYVALDITSQIASNNVVTKRFLELVEKLGLDFVVAAGQKAIADGENMARAKLRELPDGTWTSRLYGTVNDRKMGKAVPYQVVCTMTKRGDQLSFDFSGTSPQTGSSMNSTLAGSISWANVPLTCVLFQDVLWSDGKMAPLRFHVPESSILNCSFPASCAFGTLVGGVLISAMSKCLAEMLYAGRRHEDVNASSFSLWYQGGPGHFYGGKRQDGLPVPHGLLDHHGSGFGAAPHRDGVNTGGYMTVPSCGISDIERIETQYPLFYFTRNHCRDGGGFGKFAGGVGTYRIYMVYGSRSGLSVDYHSYGGVPVSAWGLFGGYPAGTGGLRAIIRCADLPARLAAGQYPVNIDELLAGNWEEIVIPSGTPDRVELPEYTIIADFVAGGGGYGDPLDRDPARVMDDIRDGLLSKHIAENVYGLSVNTGTGQLHPEATKLQRQNLRAQRLREGRRWKEPPRLAQEAAKVQGLPSLIRFHEYLEIASWGAHKIVRCLRCGHVFCDSQDNYKHYALRRVRDLLDFSGRPLPSGEAYQAVYHEYICPGCGTLLQVDTFCPLLGSDEPLWDSRLGA